MEVILEYCIIQHFVPYTAIAEHINFRSPENSWCIYVCF